MKRISNTLLSSLLVTVATVSQLAYAEKCYAVAFSSGQESSAYQVGALLGLLKKLPADQMQYHVSSGVAGGAINAVFLASQAQGNEQAAVDKMQKFWLDAGVSKLYQDWWGGVVNGLLFQGGLYDSAPLKDFITNEFAGLKMVREVSIGIVDALKGQYKEFEDNDLSQGTSLIDSLYSSFAIPGFFSPVSAFGSKFFDGSAVYEIDIPTAINKCLEKTTQENIVVDILLTSSATLQQVDAKDYRSIGMLFRFLEINSFYHSMDGLLRAKFAYPNVNFRYVISPTKSLPSSWKPLSLTQQDIQNIINQGIQDASAAVEEGQGTGFDNLVKYYKLKKTQSKDIEGVTLEEFKKKLQAGAYDVFIDYETDPLFLQYK